jgi:hypothetical protein
MAIGQKTAINVNRLIEQLLATGKSGTRSISYPDLTSQGYIHSKTDFLANC